MSSEKKISNPNPTRILIVEDHPIVREGLLRLIDKKSNGTLTVCGEVDNANDALEAVKKNKPDLVIIDIFLKESDGIELVKRIRKQYKKLPVLMLSMHDELFYAERALKAGADGYVMKQQSPEILITAIQTVLEGNLYFSEKTVSGIMRKMANLQKGADVSPVGSLSDRELEVFRLLGYGNNTRKIAKQLFISIKTVETHYSRIKEKLKLTNSNELIQNAVQWVNSKEFS